MNIELNEETTHEVEVDLDLIEVTMTWLVIPCKQDNPYGDGTATEYWTEASPEYAEWTRNGREERYYFCDEAESDDERAIFEAYEMGIIAFD